MLIHSFSGNGVGFDNKIAENNFYVFRCFLKQRIRDDNVKFTVIKKIIEKHNSIVSAKSELNIKVLVFRLLILPKALNIRYKAFAYTHSW